MAHAPSSFRDEQLARYLAIMEEVRGRVDAINFVLQGEARLAEKPATEFCFLQIRMLCELIALACLVAHGEVDGTKPLNNTWAADEILRRLARLHPTFYPHPVIFTFPSPGRIHLEDFAGDYLKQQDFARLVGLTGDILHKGSLRKFTRGVDNPDASLVGAIKWGQRLVNLINQHRIGLIGDNHIVCALRDANGVVNVSLAGLK